MCSLRWGCRVKDTAAANTGDSLRSAHAILDTLPECDAAFAESAVKKLGAVDRYVHVTSRSGSSRLSSCGRDLSLEHWQEARRTA
jgi:hypothetical protein